MDPISQLKLVFASVLLVVIFFASLTSAFGGMPSTWEMFFKGFIVCFIFWGGMLAPAFDINVKKKDNRYGME